MIRLIVTEIPSIFGFLINNIYLSLVIFHVILSPSFSPHFNNKSNNLLVLIIYYNSNYQLITNMQNLIWVLAFSFLIAFGEGIAQDAYPIIQLAQPASVSDTISKSSTERSLYLGAIPIDNDKKPVLVFVHGFTASAERWFSAKNTMYSTAYNNGYKTAFVSMTPDEGYLVNGKILGGMLEQITAHYEVSSVIIVAHSNGGKATEAAMFLENKSHLVERVITLGTPFRGTGLANLAGSSSFKWLANLLGFGGQGAATSTTYYMDGVARPLLDNEPDNEPEKFINFGAWGYNKGTTSYNAASATGGIYLNFTGGSHRSGGNDGVTPYYSSTRPGGSQQWPGCFRSWRKKKCHQISRIDHFDIATDYKMWEIIEPYFYTEIQQARMAPTAESEQTIANTWQSNFEIISTLDSYKESFTVGENTGNVILHFWHPTNSSFTIINEQTQRIIRPTLTSSSRNYTSNSTISFENLVPGTYTIQSNGAPFVGVVSYEKGPILQYDNTQVRYEQGMPIEVKVDLIGTKEQATIMGTAILEATLEGQKTEEEVYIVEFQHQEGTTYTYTLPEGLKAGVYNLTINAEGKTFRRNIVSGFAVIDNPNQEIRTTEETIMGLLTYPNPASHQATITFELVDNADIQLTIYDTYGRVVQEKAISDLSAGRHSINWQVDQLPDGIYFIEIKNNQHKLIQSFLKTP